MAWENIFRALGQWITGADLRTHQYKFVKLNSSQQIILCSVLGERAVGVLQNKPDNGRSATVAIPGSGVTKVVASAAISVGADVTTAADGRAVTAAATQQVLGVALTPAAAAGEIISVLLAYGGKV